MKSPLRRRVSPTVPFTLKVEDANGDKFEQSFRLSYDFNTLPLVEEKTGKSMLTQVGEIMDNPSVTNVSILLWAAVLENHPEYQGEEGLRTIRYNLTLATAKVALDACKEAFLLQLPADQVARLKGAVNDELPLAQSPTPTTA
jgi:hypothetical protein